MALLGGWGHESFACFSNDWRGVRTRPQYDRGMTAKIAVSLPDHLVEEARAAVAGGRVASVSAYVAEALAEKSRRRALSEVLDEMDAELGTPGTAAVARAVRVVEALDAQ